MVTAGDTFSLHAAMVQAAWSRHHKRNGFATRKITIDTILGKDDIDWEAFERNHIAYCEYRDRKGWDYCTETLLAWVENGCCPPPPEPVKTEANTRMRRLTERE
jgi:hypothetical protein